MFEHSDSILKFKIFLLYRLTLREENNGKSEKLKLVFLGIFLFISCSSLFSSSIRKI